MMGTNKIDTAVLLAAGTGSRLRPYTNDKPKCLVEVCDRPILDYTIHAIEKHQFKKLIIVTGFKNCAIEEYVNQSTADLEIETVYNKDYATTNNIYSLWLAAPLLNSPFMLLEADIIPDPDSIKHFTEPDKIALDHYDSRIHDGTTATVSENGLVKKLYIGQDAPQTDTVYKTVNICSFSEKTWGKLNREISELVKRGHLNIFYEQAIHRLLQNGEIKLEMVDFSQYWWDEIDTVDDLNRVETLLASGSYPVLSNIHQEV